MYTVYTRIMCFVLTEKKGESMNRRVDSSEEKPNNKRQKSGNDNIQSYAKLSVLLCMLVFSSLNCI